MPAMSSADHTAAMQAALRLLSIRARSEHELVERLRRRGFDAEVVDRVVQDLTNRGLVNDWAFASQRARTRVLNHQVGPRRLKEELRHKGMTKEIVETTVREIFQEVDEEEIARAGAAKRLKSLGHLSAPVALRRLAAYLLRQGFSPDTVQRVVTTLVDHRSGPRRTRKVQS
jgi:regulatory protein